jgi:hypothetical protein
VGKTFFEFAQQERKKKKQRKKNHAPRLRVLTYADVC